MVKSQWIKRGIHLLHVLLLMCHVVVWYALITVNSSF